MNHELTPSNVGTNGALVSRSSRFLVLVGASLACYCSIFSPSQAAESKRLQPQPALSCPPVTAQKPQTATSAGSLRSAVSKSERHRCLKSASEMDRIISSGRTYIIDVRPPSRLENHRIPGSLNIPLHAVKTKSFLLSNPAVIVGESYQEAELVMACTEMQRAGLTNVWILDGGIQAWEGRAEGAGGLERLQTISPRDAFLILNNADVTIVAGPKLANVNDLIRLFPGKEVVSYGQPTASRMRLFVTEDGHGSEELLPLVLHGPGQDFFLEGGAVGYRDYMVRREALLARVRRGPRTVSRCGAL